MNDRSLRLVGLRGATTCVENSIQAIEESVRF